MAANARFVDLPGPIRLPYVEQGDPVGIPVVLLHGFADSWRSFEPVLERLPASIRALALTQRGHGEASKPAAGYDLQDFSADLAAFLETLRVPAALIVGHSMGSAVALRFAIDYPEHTLGLVLAGAAPSSRAAPRARKFWEDTLDQLTDPIEPDFARELVESMVVQPVAAAFLEAMVEETLKVPKHVWQGAVESRFRSASDYAGQLEQIRAPTVILWGDRDPRYSHRDQEALVEAIPSARLTVYSGAGHLLHWEQPERFASDLANFVAGLEHDRWRGR
jgi:pimeloyl-ACP methyl ester carboxylesterase